VVNKMRALNKAGESGSDVAKARTKQSESYRRREPEDNGLTLFPVLKIDTMNRPWEEADGN
jgi:hypothetical protein